METTKRKTWSIWENYKEDIENYLRMGVNVKSIYLILINDMKKEGKEKVPVLDSIYKYIKRKEEET
jgi:hypothetical protein